MYFEMSWKAHPTTKVELVDLTSKKISNLKRHRAKSVLENCIFDIYFYKSVKFQGLVTLPVSSLALLTVYIVMESPSIITIKYKIYFRPVMYNSWRSLHIHKSRALTKLSVLRQLGISKMPFTCDSLPDHSYETKKNIRMDCIYKYSGSHTQ